MNCPSSYHSLIFVIESGYGFADNISSGCSLSTCSQMPPSMSIMKNFLKTRPVPRIGYRKLRTFLSATRRLTDRSLWQAEHKLDADLPTTPDRCQSRKHSG